MTPVRGEGRPARGRYRLADGTVVPSVTTITSRFKESGGLVHWAWKLGTEGVDYRAARDNAASAGSICHQWIEDWLHATTQTEFQDVDEEVLHNAQGGFQAFSRWARLMDVRVLETETPLVSEEYRFGGTVDCVATVADELMCLDWKTSNSVYEEYVLQLAAYRELLRERGGEAPSEALLLRVGKLYGDFHLHSYSSRLLDRALETFLCLRTAYDGLAEIKKAAA